MKKEDWSGHVIDSELYSFFVFSNNKVNDFYFMMSRNIIYLRIKDTKMILSLVSNGNILKYP